MALSAFDDKSRTPKPRDVEKVLGRTASHWEALRSRMASEYAPLEETWNFAGANWGWSLRLRQKKRTVMYMTPGKGHFSVGFVIGEKAAAAASRSDLSKKVLTLVDQAKKYAEGRGVRIEVRNKNDRIDVEKLAAIKMTTK